MCSCLLSIGEGFREKRSTEYAILDIINEIDTNMDKKLYSCGVFIDLQKAFDTVNHSIGPKNISKKEVVLSGVPQGSVLGPLLFLIYINDISNSSDKLKFYLFADDTNLLYADKNLKSLESTVNAEIFRVYNWLIANKLSLNIKKSNFVIFRPRQKKLNH